MNPVVIVGAGPVGVTAGTLLARRGVDVIVLERHRAPYPLPRAVHLDDEIYRVLQELGVAERFSAISRPIPGMRLVDARHRTMAEFRRDAPIGFHGHPQANLFDQPELEALLLENMATEPRIELRRGCEVVGIDGTRVAWRNGDDTGTIEASAVLGCDGANSAVRTAIGASLVGLGFEERWLVIDLRVPTPLAVWSGVHQICDPARAATFMHVTGERYRWEFRMRADETTAALVAPGPLADLLRPWFPDGLPADVTVVRSAGYTFRAAVADRWRDGRVFLLGDAAHLMPPFIGQGMGTGLRDAANLAWKLAGVLHGELPETVLATYEPERRSNATHIIRKAISVGWALTGGQDGAATIRRAAAAVICRIPGVTGLILGTTVPRLPASALVEGAGPMSPNGMLFPQPRPGLDARLGTGYALVSVGPLTAATAARARELGVTVTEADDEPVLRAWFRRHAARAVLVRPDRIVAATTRTRNGVSSLLDHVPTLAERSR